VPPSLSKKSALIPHDLFTCFTWLSK